MSAKQYAILFPVPNLTPISDTSLREKFMLSRRVIQTTSLSCPYENNKLLPPSPRASFRSHLDRRKREVVGQASNKILFSQMNPPPPPPYTYAAEVFFLIFQNILWWQKVEIEKGSFFLLDPNWLRMLLWLAQCVRTAVVRTKPQKIASFLLLPKEQPSTSSAVNFLDSKMLRSSYCGTVLQWIADQICKLKICSSATLHLSPLNLIWVYSSCAQVNRISLL